MKLRNSFISRTLSTRLYPLRLFSTDIRASQNEYDEQMDKARNSVKIGQSKEADKHYRFIINKYPKNETAYRELFRLWCQNRSVLGLAQEEIDWLRSEYKNNFPKDDSSASSAKM